MAGDLLRSRIDLRRPVGRGAGWVDHDLGSILAVPARVPIAVVVSVFAFGIVATLASSIYARDLFADVPAPIDWDREV
ncbi:MULTISPECIES: hypothetical protein [unclassified Rhodococcus (in: high G+C Gram-positive bacteria)]|uniref:hypothetical protein n=1 Tax=unclassified Rhodococcus (in: high G+C Gram-positive bacteria) TaxID=192944 RepID=UPI0012E3992A|nr:MULTISPECIES: hypothetical protein [unclassified Rhodococcus (in: high G+C Gram-positive bacteria)]